MLPSTRSWVIEDPSVTHLIRACVAAFLILLVTVLLPTLLLPLLLIATIIIWATIDEASAQRITVRWPLVLFLILCLLVAMKAGQVPDNLNVPPFSRFVPGFGTNIGNDPLIGSPSERPFIDRLWVSQRLVPFVLFGSILLWALSFSRKFPKAVIALAIFTALLLWQCALIPTAVQVVGPIASLSRIIPFVVFYPLEQVFFVGFIVLIGLMLQSFRLSKVHLLAAFLPIYILTLAQPNSFFGTLVFPKKHRDAIELLNSPSLHVIKENLPRPPLRLQRIRLKVKDVQLITASTNQDQLAHIFDHDADSRWSTKPDHQHGGEWIQIQMKTPQTIKGIELPLPLYWGDYPRGVLVKGGISENGTCNPQKILYKEPWWRGAVEKFPNGNLGLTPESSVNLYFSEPVTVDCIKVEQTGYDKTFEWSVEKILLLY